MNQYRHYGSLKFNIDIFDPIENYPYFTKPHGGLWATPVNSDIYGWKSWCQDNDYNVYRLKEWFDFDLDESANVYRIKELKDVLLLESLECCFISDRIRAIEGSDIFVSFVDFEKLKFLGYDAVELEINPFTYWAMYGWDCDSIVIMNPDIIISN